MVGYVTSQRSLWPVTEPMSHRQFVAYYRVSTDRQGRSGLGLDAQRAAVARHLDGHVGELVAEYTEVESGARSERPQLAAALRHCRREGATLIIAKLDRLARSVHFISGLMDSGVDFVAADMPGANDFMLHIYAAVAQEERRLISQRTREALAAAKARGVRLGNPRLKRHNDRQRAQAERFARSLAPVVEAIRGDGHTSVRAIRDQLNARGVPTPAGGRWHVPSVHRLLKRLEATA